MEVYRQVPKLAYMGTALIGIGTQLVAMGSLSAIEDTQVCIARKRLTKKSRSQAASLWVICWMVAVYCGNMVALLVMKLMTFTQGGFTMVACSLLSAGICTFLQIMYRRSKSVTDPVP